MGGLSGIELPLDFMDDEVALADRGTAVLVGRGRAAVEGQEDVLDRDRRGNRGRGGLEPSEGDVPRHGATAICESPDGLEHTADVEAEFHAARPRGRDEVREVDGD